MKKLILKKCFIFFGILFLPAAILIAVVFILYPDNSAVLNISMVIWFLGVLGFTFIFLIPVAIKNIVTSSMHPQPVPKNKKKKQKMEQEKQSKSIKQLDRIIKIFSVHSALCLVMTVVLVILRFTYFS